MKRKFVLLAATLGWIAAAAPAAPTSGYHIIKKVVVPGAGGWDYVTVDDAGRRVYVSHATQVEVLNADTFELVGTIPNTPGVHGIAIASEFGRGFITAGKSDSVVIFDLNTLKTIGEVKVGKKPDAIIYDPATKHVFAMNGDSDSTTVINAADGKVVGTIDLGGGPEFAVADGKGNVYVNLEEKAETVHIDSNSIPRPTISSCPRIWEASSPFSFSANKEYSAGSCARPCFHSFPDSRAGFRFVAK